MSDVSASTCEPRWITLLDEALASSSSGVILTGNTGDRVHLAQERGEISGLVEALATVYSRRGYRVGVYRNSSGFEELTPPGSKAGSRSTSAFSNIPCGSCEPLIVLPAIGHAQSARDRT